MLSTPQLLMTPGPVSSLMPPYSRPVSSPLPNVPTRHFKCNTAKVEPGMFPDLLLPASALVNPLIPPFRQKNWELPHFLPFSQTPPSSIHESSDLFGTSPSLSSFPTHSCLSFHGLSLDASCRSLMGFSPPPRPHPKAAVIALEPKVITSLPH